MNWEATKIIRKREEETKALGGEAAYRLKALQNLKLKTVIKESHATTVHTLGFNNVDPECSNLFATVGGDQATIYDDSHMGDYIGVVVHFVNSKTEHAEGGELQAATWINSKDWTEHPHGDACLAVAGADPSISIISVVEAAVVKLLKGHTKDVVDLATTANEPKLLLSLSKDGNIRLWNVVEEACLASITTSDATCIALSPDGRSIAVGTSRGRIMRYTITESDEEGTLTVLDASKEEFKPQTDGGSHSESIDCLSFLPDNRLATKSTDGRMFVWDTTTAEQKAAWKVPGCNSLGGFTSRCQFTATADGKYISVGNASGDCYVYDSETGKREAHVSVIKVSAPVRACALSHDCRHLVAAVGNGFLFRFEYMGEIKSSEDAENENGNADASADMDT
jgi:WD40 repeat protein